MVQTGQKPPEGYDFNTFADDKIAEYYGQLHPLETDLETATAADPSLGGGRPPEVRYYEPRYDRPDGSYNFMNTGTPSQLGEVATETDYWNYTNYSAPTVAGVPEDYMGFFDYNQIMDGEGTDEEKRQSVATHMMNKSQTGETEGKLGNLLAYRDAYGEIEEGYAGAQGMYDEGERRALRSTAQNYSQNRSSGMQGLGRRGLAGSTIAGNFDMASRGAQAGANQDVLGNYASQRANLQISQANAMVGLLTGQNIGGGLNPQQTYNMGQQFGQSGAGQGMPKQDERGFWQSFAPMAAGALGTAFGGPIGGAAAAGVTSWLFPEDNSGYARV